MFNLEYCVELVYFIQSEGGTTSLRDINRYFSKNPNLTSEYLDFLISISVLENPIKSKRKFYSLDFKFEKLLEKYDARVLILAKLIEVEGIKLTSKQVKLSDCYED
ncbi:MAG: hypothetical protein QXL51_01060 [Candidatus Aenigmatarchaeota archaeon]